MSGNFKIYLLLCVIGLTTQNCAGQPESKTCKDSYSEAKQMLNNYYQDSLQINLQSALKSIEKALNCQETKKKAVHLKTSLLVLMKEYNYGAKFIDSLAANDFQYDYKKEFIKFYFICLDFESKKDNSNYLSTLKKMGNIVEVYIESRKDKVAHEVYHDLFFVRSKLYGHDQIVEEINGLIVKYPAEKNFFKSLIESYNPRERESEPIHN